MYCISANKSKSDIAKGNKAFESVECGAMHTTADISLTEKEIACETHIDSHIQHFDTSRCFTIHVFNIHYVGTTKTCHIFRKKRKKSLSIVLMLLSDDRESPSLLSISCSNFLFVCFFFILRFLPFICRFQHVRLIYIYQKIAHSKFTDDFTRLFAMPLGTCRVSFIFDLNFYSPLTLAIVRIVFYLRESKLNCSQSNGTLISNFLIYK